MSQATVNFEVDGFVNLGTALIAEGYTGQFAGDYLEVINENAETVYIHFTDNGNVEPAVGADGIAIGNAEVSVSYRAERHGEHIDLGTIWLYSANPVDVKVIVRGRG